MEKDIKQPDTETSTTPVTPVASEATAQPEKKVSDNRGERGDAPGRRHNRRSPRRDTRTKPEFDQKIISLRRVTRVMGGGRRFSFSVSVVAGNKKGMVGVGTGKASDTPLAIDKAYRDAKKNLITVKTTKDMSIPHDVEVKYSASRVKIMPAKGKGILAGSSARVVFELAGLKDVGAKFLSRSKNTTNNARATIKALEGLRSTKISK